MSKKEKDIREEAGTQPAEPAQETEKKEEEAGASAGETADAGTAGTDRLEEMGRKLADINDKYLRLSAEFDNYRKRTLKERMELTRNAGQQILEQILPVMDNFERALKSMEVATDVPALREGVELIYGNFRDFLNQNGVKEMECIQADFDPEFHEAVTKIPAPSEELKGKVVDCIQKGYTMNEKVIRFPKVVVGE